MTDYFDTRLDELLQYETWCKCGDRACQRFYTYDRDKQAIKNLVADEMLELIGNDKNEFCAELRTKVTKWRDNK